jgi:hypothetical protein
VKLARGDPFYTEVEALVTPLALALLLAGTDQAALHAAAAATCAAFPLRTTGTIHYFCDCQAGAQAGCVPGNDATAMTSMGSPSMTRTCRS